MSVKRKDKKKNISESSLIKIFKIVLIVTTFIFYYNSIFNYFFFFFFHVNTKNAQTVAGIKSIPEIFSTLYADESGMTYGYRPMVRASYAIEYQFTSGLSYNPYISHAINVLLYIISILLLYKVLRRLLRDYNIWFPFLITLLFMAHPAHTEVVASLKNRDVLLNFLFSFIAIWQFVKWVDTDKLKHLILGVMSFVFALLSKETAIAQLAVFPLVLYFFTDIKLKKLGVFSSIIVGVLLILVILKLAILPASTRELMSWENPLTATHNFMLTISTGLYVIWFYIKLMFVPFPLLYYYGYNMLPVVGWSNPFVILSLLLVAAMLAYALLKIKEKNILSFAILYFFVTISMYTNIVAPVPGIVGDRFVFFTTISFSIFVIWLLFLIFKIHILKSDKNKKNIFFISLFVALILLPYGYYTHVRNKQWQTEFTLYSADMPRLWNSVKANNLYANELMKRVNNELAKPVNPYKFIIGLINNAEKHFQQAIKLDSTLSTSYNNLGIIYSKIHGNQAKIRMQSYLKRNELKKAEKERVNSQKDFGKAVNYFRKAIANDPSYASAYFNLANTYDLQNKYDSSIVYFKKVIDIDGGKIISMSRLANAYFHNNNINKAIAENKLIIKKYPKSDMSYINLGNYAIVSNDTIAAINYFEKAVELGTKPQVGQLLSSYFSSKGNNQKANYYYRKSKESEELLKKK